MKTKRESSTKQNTNNNRDVEGVINPESVYTLNEFSRRVGLTRQNGLRAARNAGLRTIAAHGKKFVRGRDFIDYLEKVATPMEVV